MIRSLKHHLGYRSALRAVRKRSVKTWSVSARDRKVLVLLPDGEEALRTAWGFVRSLSVLTSHVIPVSLSDGVAYTPDAYAGAVFKVGEKLHDWRGIPKRIITEAIWTQRPDVALDLTDSFELGAAYLVGASSAAFRIGFYSDEGEPFYDFMIAPRAGYESALDAMRHHLSAIHPPVLEFE